MADLSLTPEQLDVLTRTVLGEARGEGQLGMEAVAHVLNNRAQSGQFPSDPALVARQPNQFSTWNDVSRGGNNPQQFSPSSPLYQTAQQAIQNVFGGNSPDPTYGAMYFHTPNVSPSWANNVNQYGTTQIGNHIFYNGRALPVPVTPATQSPDLALMRNPIMSMEARDRQATPFPREQSIDLLMRRTPGETIATIPTSGVGQPPSTRVVQSVPMGGSNRSAVNDAARRAALLANQSYVERSTGLPVVQGTKATSSQVNDAARRAALTMNQSYVERAPGMGLTANRQPTAQEIRDAERRAALTANQSYVERSKVPAVTPAEEQTEIGRMLGIYSNGGPTRPGMNNVVPGPNPVQKGQERLAATPVGLNPTWLGNDIGQMPSFAALGARQTQVVTNPGLQAPIPMPYTARPGSMPIATANIAPVPMPANMRPSGLAGGGVGKLAPTPMPAGNRPAGLPIAAGGGSGPTRIIIDGAGSYSAPAPVALTPVQQYQSMGLSPSQAYDVANQQAAANAYRNAYGKEDTRSDWFKSVTGG